MTIIIILYRFNAEVTPDTVSCLKRLVSEKIKIKRFASHH